MGMIRVISPKGDERRTWTAAAEDREAEAAVREAERIFDEGRASGRSAYAIERGGTLVKITVFDSFAEQILLFPPVIGG